MKPELPMQHASSEKHSFENSNILDELKIDQAFRLAQGKLNCGKGVDKSLPAAKENFRNSSVTTMHTVCKPASVWSVLQQPSRK